VGVEARQQEVEGLTVATEKQQAAARQNIWKASAAAERQKTISHLPKSTRTAMGKKGAAARKHD
jgi:hypothetical protein